MNHYYFSVRPRFAELSDALIVTTVLDQKAKLVYSQDKCFRRFDEDIKICELP